MDAVYTKHIYVRKPNSYPVRGKRREDQTGRDAEMRIVFTMAPLLKSELYMIDKHLEIQKLGISPRAGYNFSYSISIFDYWIFSTKKEGNIEIDMVHGYHRG